MKATLRVDRSACHGTGLCQAMEPELFQLTSSGHAVPLETELRDGERIQNAQDVGDCCPMGAVIVTVEGDAEDPCGTGDDSA